MRCSLTSAALFVSLTGTAFAQDTQSFDRIERGRYLAILSDCAACHTAPGGAPYAGGLALQTPFGILVAPNITSDLPETGIGNMTNEEFLSVLHEGRGHNGKRLYLGDAVSGLYQTEQTDDDVLAMRSYFWRTVAPVRNKVVSNQLAVPAEHSPRDGVLERTQLSPPAAISPIRRNPRNGIAAPISSRARRIVAPATRPRRCSAATRTVSR